VRSHGCAPAARAASQHPHPPPPHPPPSCSGYPYRSRSWKTTPRSPRSLAHRPLRRRKRRISSLETQQRTTTSQAAAASVAHPGRRGRCRTDRGRDRPDRSLQKRMCQVPKESDLIKNRVELVKITLKSRPVLNTTRWLLGTLI
jgi:hypothetical protein